EPTGEARGVGGLRGGRHRELRRPGFAQELPLEPGGPVVFIEVPEAPGDKVKPALPGSAGIFRGELLGPEDEMWIPGPDLGEDLPDQCGGQRVAHVDPSSVNAVLLLVKGDDAHDIIP